MSAFTLLLTCIFLKLISDAYIILAGQRIILSFYIVVHKNFLKQLLQILTYFDIFCIRLTRNECTSPHQNSSLHHACVSALPCIIMSTTNFIFLCHRFNLHTSSASNGISMITQRAKISSAVYSNRSYLWVCLCACVLGGLLPR